MNMVLGDYSSLVRKGSFAILDQGLFAGTNFIVYILLARWLAPSEYGAFAVAFSIFLFFGALYNAILIEPMLVFGPGKYKAYQRNYTGMLMYVHVGTTVPLSLFLLLAAFLLGSFYTVQVKNAMIGLSISSPMILLLWLTRRAFYVRFKPAWSAIGGLFYLFLFLGMIAFIRNLGRLTQTSVFLAMGCSSLVVALLLLAILAPQWQPVGSLTLSEIVREHWRYGRWALGTASLRWVPANVYYIVLPAIVGLTGVAILRALMNLALPAQHAIAALSVLLLPMLSKTVNEHGLPAMVLKARKFLTFFLIAACLYFAALLVFRKGILTTLYADQYADYAHMVPLIGLLPFTAGVIGVLGSVLRAGERPDSILVCYFISSSVALVAGITLTLTLGVVGAIIGLILASVTTAGTLYLFFRNMSPHS